MMSIYLITILALTLGFILLQEYLNKQEEKGSEGIYEEMQPTD